MSQQAVKLGSTEYMQGLVEAVKKLERIQKVTRSKWVEDLVSGALDLIRKRVHWPVEEEDKRGFFCEDCGLVCYVGEDWIEEYPDRFDRCPQCKSWGWYFITETNWQPKVQYGTLERRVCECCGAIVYGARDRECPMCNAELGE